MNRVQNATTISAAETNRWIAGFSPRVPIGSKPAWIRFLLAGLCLVLLGTSAHAQTLTATVSVGSDPNAVAVNPLTNMAYIVNTHSSSITAINGLTNATTTISVGNSPSAVAVNPVTNTIYVANNGDGTVSIINGATGTVSGAVTVGTNPSAIAVNPATNKIYVANLTSGTVTIINGATNGTTSVTVGNQPRALAVNPITNEIYIANYAAGSISVINGVSGTVTATANVGSHPNALAVNSATNEIYVANSSGATVSVINGQNNTVSSTVSTGTTPDCIAVNPVTNKIYVANSGSSYITVIDGANGNSFSNLTIGSGATTASAVAVDLITNQVYVANAGAGTLVVLNGATSTNAASVSDSVSLSTGANPTALAVNPVTNKIYAVNTATTGTVAVIDGFAINAMNVVPYTTVSVGNVPYAVAIDTVTNKIYVTNQSDSTVTVIDGNGVNAAYTVAVGNMPGPIAVNQVTNTVYVACASNNPVGVVSVLSGDTGTTRAAVTATINAGRTPDAIAVNPVTNVIYVTNYADNDVTIINGANNTATPIGLNGDPVAVAVNPSTNLTYVATFLTSGIRVIDGGNNVTQIADANGPWAIAINSVTNKIYVANQTVTSLTVVDANNSNSITTSPMENGSVPFAIALNPITNMVYVANQGSNIVDVFNGATDSTAATLNTSIDLVEGANSDSDPTPGAIVVDPVTNRIYVGNLHVFYFSCCSMVTEIDGASNTANWFYGDKQAAALAISPVTGKLYVVEQGSNDVLVVSEQPVESIPLTVNITPLTNNQTSTLAPTFNFTDSNTLTNGAAADNLLYQIDSWDGPWVAASAISGGFSATTAALQPGYHILYAFATDGEEGTSTVTGLSGSPVIGGISAYGFLVSPSGAALTPISLTFPSTEAGTSSAAQTVTLINGGVETLTFSVAVSANYIETAGDPCSLTGGTLAPGASCSISIQFSPSSAGNNITGTVTVTDNSNGIPGSQQTASLSGTATGNANPGISWTPTVTITYGAGLTNAQLDATTTVAPAGSGTFTYTPALGAIIGAGAQTLSVTYTPTGTYAATYATTTKTIQINVNKAPLTVTASSISSTYGQTPPYAATYGPFVNGDTSSVITGAPGFSVNTSTSPIPVGTYTITPGLGTLTAANYTFTNFVTGTLTVQAATTTTVTSNPTTTPTYGTSITFTATIAASSGTPSGNVSFYDASSGATCSALGASLQIGTQQSLSGVGTASVTTSSLTAATHTILVCYSGASFFMASAGTLTEPVSQAMPTITWAAPAPITYGTALSSAQLDATASVPGSTSVGTNGFVYSQKSGTVLGTGTTTLSVTFTPQDSVDYKQATASVQLVVGSAPANSEATVTDTITTGTNPAAVAVNPVTNTTYVANTGSNTVAVITGSTNATTTVNVGSQPDAVAVNPITNKIYVADYGDGTVTEIDGATNTPTTINVGRSPTVIAVDPVTNQIYVVNSADGTVTVIDGTGNNMPATITVGTNPYAVAVNSVTNTIYVTNQGSTGVSGSIMAINGANNSVIATIPDASGPYSVAVNDVTNEVYVTNLGATTITVINAGSANAVGSVSVGSLPWAVAVNPVTNKIYVANNGSGTVTVINANNANATTPVTVGTSPVAIAVNPITNQIYVANQGSANFTVIDGSSNNPTTVSAGNGPNAVAVNPVTNKIYVANVHSNGVSVIDGATNTTATIGVGRNPSAVAVNPVTNNVYVANTDDGTVSVINGATVTPVTVGASPNSVAVNPITNKTYVVNNGAGPAQGLSTIDGNNGNAATFIAVGGGADAVALNPVTNQIYVANYNDGTVTVVDGASNAAVATIGVGTGPEGIAVNPITNQVYVLNFGPNNGGGNGTVTVIDGSKNTVITNVNVANDPFAIAMNPVTNRVYVVNSNLFNYPTAGSVTMIDGNNNFTPTSIPAGTEPYAVAVNPVTNQIYVVNKDSFNVMVIDGVTNLTTSLTLANNSYPWAVAVNPVTNKIYVVNGGGNNITVIDGATNFITTVSAGSQPFGIAVNPVTNQIYVADQNSNNVTALTEQQIQTIPITTAITPLAGNSTASPTPAFSFAVTNSFTTAPANNLLFQVDTWGGPWQSATSQGSGNFNAITSLLSAGYHTLYAYATDGEEGTSTITGLQSSPLIGNIQAYGFLVTATGGTTGGANVEPGTINFGGQEKGISSSAQITTLVNSTSSPLTFAITLSGPNSTDFAEATAAPDTCSALHGTLAASSSCSIGVIFTPKTKTSESATLTVTDNPNAVAGTTQTVALSGIGTGNVVPTLAWAPGTLTYGTALTGGQQPTAADPTTMVALPGTFTYSPVLTTLGVGIQSVAVTFTPSDTADYTTATQTFQVTVGKAVLTVSPAVTTWPYAQPAAIAPVYGGFLNGDTSAVLSGSPAFTTSATTNPIAVGTYTITAAQGTLQAANYSFTFGSAGLTVTRATPAITWGSLTPIPVGTALSSSQLNASASILGNSSIGTNGFVYTPATGTVLAAGIQTLSVTFTPQDSTDYTTATVTNPLQVYIPTGANLVTTDTSTQGNWSKNYGADGYLLANVTNQKLPAYDSTFTAPAVLSWTYATGTTDPRALQIPGGTGGIASAWYDTAAFTFNVSFTDGNAHQFALYALDWDNLGRNETITITDANTGATLSTKTISNFTNGVYVVWNISGSVKITLTGNNGPNALINGIFFGAGTGGSGSGPESVSVIPGTASLNANGTQQFTATITNPTTTGEAVTWTINPPTSGSISTTGLYTAPTSIPAATTVTVTATTADATAATGTATVTLNPAAGADGNSATFVKTDTTTQGTWMGAYGGDGHALATITPQVIPTYGTFSVANAATWTYASSTTDPRALETGLGSARSAAVWYSTGSFYYDVNFTDGNTHQVALYAVDWDTDARVETIQIVDGASGVQLATQTISNFNSGEYLVYNISGHVKINLTFTGGANSSISGVFFDPVGGTTGGGGTGTESVRVGPTTASLSANGTQQFTATITNPTTTGEAVTWTINPPTSGSISTTGLYTAPATISTSSTVTVTATTADATAATGTATVTLNATVAGNGNSATFVKTDTTTEGTWIGTYGGDGNAMANITSQPGQGVPAYATFAVANQANWTYATGTTDLRALETGLGTGRTAAAWYESSPFNMNVIITDGGTHQVAMYAVDWDNQGRIETIQVVDGTSGAILDSRTISNFNTTGEWLVWNVSGSVKFIVTTGSGPNAEVSGVFFGPVSGGTSGGGGGTGTESVAVGPTTASLSANGTQQFTATITNPTTTGEAVTWTINPPTSGSISTTGLYMAPTTISTSSTVTVTATTADATAATGTATVTLNATVAGGGNSATFVKTDTATEGTWIGTYGGDGNAMANITSQPGEGVPSYATFSVANQANWTWAASTTDPRALETGLGSGRQAATWYEASPFNFNVTITDGGTHQIALYAVDWDNAGRTETIQIVDGTTGAQLDSRTISNFNATGEWLVWNVSGSVKINVTTNAGVNAVVSGIFFAPAGGTTGGGGGGGTGTESVAVTPTTASLSANGTQQFAATITNPTTTGEGVTWTINPPTSGSISTTGLYTAPTTITTSSTVTVTATTADATAATATATVTLNATVAGSGNSATFVKTDTTTQGTWMGTYGGDGHALATITPQVIPTYGTFSVVNAATWTYASSTTDPRALETGLGSARSAAVWYSTGSFYYDINFTDGNTHQVALYAVDWDSTARVETIQIVDGASGVQLATQTISGFNSGEYLVYNISGHVKINLTFTGGANSSISGVFFDPVGGTTSDGGGSTGTESVAVGPTTASLSANGTQQFTATITNPTTTGEAVTWTINPPTSGSISTTGLYTAPATISTSSTVTVTATTADATAATGTATVTLNATVAGSGNSATFLRTDTLTQGTWMGAYGGDGYALATITPQSIPTYAAFSVVNAATWTYASSTTDLRALETGLGSARTAAVWYSTAAFYFDLNMTDGNTHQFALYALDWDNQGRTETIQIVDATTGAPLSTQTVSNFTSGEYLVWNISGHVKINLSFTAGPNAVISGVFFK